MTIRHLSTFIKVCELNSVTKAAEELHISQPSVSECLKELEEYYGVILFDRVGKRLVITPEGLILLREAKDVIREFDEFESIARNENLNKDIRIGATMTFGAFIVPKLNKLIHENIKEANPLFYIDKPAGLEEKIIKGDLDFALEEGVINSELLIATNIGEDELVAICSIEFNAPNKLKLTDLTKYDLLLRERGNPSRRILDYELLKKGVKLSTPRVESVSNNAILSMAMEGQGIGILPSAIARKYILSGAIRRIELDTPLKRKLFLVRHKHKTFNKTCKRVYDMALTILENK